VEELLLLSVTYLERNFSYVHIYCGSIDKLASVLYGNMAAHVKSRDSPRCKAQKINKTTFPANSKSMLI
jgi:hypothetical protein